MKKIIFFILCISLCFICVGCKNKTEENLNNDKEVEENISDFSSCYKIEGDLIYFGYYPQTIASQEEVKSLSSTSDKNGFYTSNIDGSKYIKYKTKDYSYLETLEFSNGEQVKKNNEYYFKCEPIVWRIINNKNNYVTIATVNLLDCYPFIAEENVVREVAVINDEQTSVWFNIKNNVPKGIYANSWEYSDLREWLNSDFKNHFSQNEQSILQLSELDNSSSKLEYSSLYPWVKQKNTFDYFYIFSFEDVINNKLGFNIDSNNKDMNRSLKVTDFAKAKGVMVGFKFEDELNKKGLWLLRSSGIYSSFISGVNVDGSVKETHSFITDDNRGLCIVTQIKLK
ncbi:MAG: hypothetical protein IJ008_01225 [Clostridia bacterium]|nr:hypothetical protein [Clostridia bacterium]